MVVVFHHIGNPKSRTINQNEPITHMRLRISHSFSGGGSFRVDGCSAVDGGNGVAMAVVDVMVAV